MILVLFSNNIAWLLNRLRITMGLRRLETKPIQMVSRFSPDLIKGQLNQNNVVRVLVFSHNLNLEGASISLKEMICGLKEIQEIIPEVITFSDGPLRSEYEAHGIRVEVITSFLHKISTLKSLSFQVTALASRIQKFAPDIVFVNTLLNFPAILAAEYAGVPSVWNVREGESWNRYFCFLSESVAQQAVAAIGLPQSVVFVSDSTRKVWKDFERASNFKVIHNALNIDRFSNSILPDRKLARSSLGWSADEIIFLCVGTICERKGQLDILRAIESIAGRIKVNVRVVFVGDNKSRYGQALQRYAKRFQGSDRVRVHFDVLSSDIVNYYLAADTFLFSSRVESNPRVILEALSFGLPIITTSIYGVLEQVPDPSDVLFYEPGDVMQLGIHILEIVSSPDLRQSLSCRAKKRFAEMLTFDEMLEAYKIVIIEAAKVVDNGSCSS